MKIKIVITLLMILSLSGMLKAEYQINNVKQYKYKGTCKNKDSYMNDIIFNEYIENNIQKESTLIVIDYSSIKVQYYYIQKTHNNCEVIIDYIKK